MSSVSVRPARRREIQQLVGKLDHHALALCGRQAAPARLFKCGTRGGNSASISASLQRATWVSSAAVYR
jgi:hypothetical protein